MKKTSKCIPQGLILNEDVPVAHTTLSGAHIVPSMYTRRVTYSRDNDWVVIEIRHKQETVYREVITLSGFFFSKDLFSRARNARRLLKKARKISSKLLKTFQDYELR